MADKPVQSGLAAAVPRDILTWVIPRRCLIARHGYGAEARRDKNHSGSGGYVEQGQEGFVRTSGPMTLRSGEDLVGGQARDLVHAAAGVVDEHVQLAVGVLNLLYCLGDGLMCEV